MAYILARKQSSGTTRFPAVVRLRKGNTMIHREAPRPHPRHDRSWHALPEWTERCECREERVAFNACDSSDWVELTAQSRAQQAAQVARTARRWRTAVRPLRLDWAVNRWA